jgi:hypothetical protein
MPSFVLGFVDETTNEISMKDIAKDELQVVRNSFQKDKSQNLMVGQ